MTCAGTYDDWPWGGETIVRPWEDGLALIAVPSMQPPKEMLKLRKAGEQRFRRMRKDESLAEEFLFEIGPDGRSARYVRHSNPSRRLPRLRAAFLCLRPGRSPEIDCCGSRLSTPDEVQR